MINIIWHSESIERYSARPTQDLASCDLDVTEFAEYAAMFRVGNDR